MGNPLAFESSGPGPGAHLCGRCWVWEPPPPPRDGRSGGTQATWPWSLDLPAGEDRTVTQTLITWRKRQPICYCSRGRRTANWTTTTVKIKVNGDLRWTTTANRLQEDCLNLGSAKLTAFQNYPNHLVRTLRAYTTLEPYVDIGWWFPIPGTWDIWEAR